MCDFLVEGMGSFPMCLRAGSCCCNCCCFPILAVDICLHSVRSGYTCSTCGVACSLEGNHTLRSSFVLSGLFYRSVCTLFLDVVCCVAVVHVEVGVVSACLNLGGVGRRLCWRWRCLVVRGLDVESQCVLFVCVICWWEEQGGATFVLYHKGSVGPGIRAVAFCDAGWRNPW